MLADKYGAHTILIIHGFDFCINTHIGVGLITSYIYAIYVLLRLFNIFDLLASLKNKGV